MSTEAKKTPEVKRIVPKEVLELLSKGYTRYKKDDLGYGSIQEKYNLNTAECKDLFSRPFIKGVKTKTPSLLIIEDEAPVAPPTTQRIPPPDVETSKPEIEVAPNKPDEGLFS
jgi:hypothetical protein